MIYVEDTAVKIGGKLLPGVFKSMEIDSSAKVEEQEVKGSASKPKQAVGYEDAKINIEIQLDDDADGKKTLYKKLAIIQNLFKKADQDKPVVYPIINEHTAARGVKQVIFKKLSTKELNGKSTMIVTLEFWEYIPMKITAKKAATTTASTASAASPTANTTNASSTNPVNLNQDYKSYLGADRGSAPGYSNKTAASPAVDNANTAAALNRLTSIPNAVRE